jgi:hypothetical protein
MSQTAKHQSVSTSESPAPKVAKQVKAKKVTAKAATGVKKAKANHPKFIDMISEAIAKLDEGRSGSSRQAIVKYISATYGVDQAHANLYVKKELANGVQSGHLNHVKGIGANGSFSLSKKAKEEILHEERGEAAKPARKRVVKNETTAAAAEPKPKKSRTVSNSKKDIVHKVATTKSNKRTTTKRATEK